MGASDDYGIKIVLRARAFRAQCSNFANRTFKVQHGLMQVRLQMTGVQQGYRNYDGQETGTRVSSMNMRRALRITPTLVDADRMLPLGIGS